MSGNKPHVGKAGVTSYKTRPTSIIEDTSGISTLGSTADENEWVQALSIMADRLKRLSKLVDKQVLFFNHFIDLK
jgi:hypothetical protein